MSENINSLEIVLANSKSYEDIQERKTKGFSDIEKALSIVREFIVRKKRILYGGMSIDISLRLAGHPGIYADDAVPDYDFYSDDIEGDANEIADILHKAGFEGVNAHNAQHATTRRVKINLANNVADVSYMPKEIYDRIPTQMYKNMRVTHPLFQWMDVHRAFSQPFEKPPWEVITHRIHKDIKRYRMLYEEYKIPYKKEYISKFSNIGKLDMYDVDISKIQSPKSFMFGGYQSYAFIYRFLFYMIDSKSVFHDTLRDVGTLDKIQDLFNQAGSAMMSSSGSKLTFGFPNGTGNAGKRVNIVSDDFPGITDSIDKKVFSGKAQKTFYEMYGDYLRPRTIVLEKSGNPLYEIFDNLGHMQPGYDLHETISVLHKINPDSKKTMQIAESHGKGKWIMGPQNIILYSLQKYHDYNTPDNEREYHLYMYQSGIWLIEAAEMIVNTIRNVPSTKSGFADLYRKLPFFLTTQLYGEENWSADYLSFIYYKTYLVEGVPNDKQKKTRPPYAYYPDHPYESEKFDLESSPMFQMSGKKVKGPFIAISLDPYDMEKYANE